MAMNSLMRAVAKHVPSKRLLSSFVDMPAYKVASEQVGIRSSSCTPPLKGIQKEICAYFDVMTRALRVAEQPLILELLRQLNKIFLESFDEGEEEVWSIIARCEVTKLNLGQRECDSIIRATRHQAQRSCLQAHFPPYI